MGWGGRGDAVAEAKGTHLEHTSGRRSAAKNERKGSMK